MRWCGRLRRSSEIAFVRRSGRRAETSTLIAYGADSRDPSHRLAISISKSVGAAVVRNLVRRRVRGALDGLTAPAGFIRFVIIAKPAAATEPYARLASDVAAVLARLATA